MMLNVKKKSIKGTDRAAEGRTDKVEYKVSRVHATTKSAKNNMKEKMLFIIKEEVGASLNLKGACFSHLLSLLTFSSHSTLLCSLSFPSSVRLSVNSLDIMQISMRRGFVCPIVGLPLQQCLSVTPR